MSLLAGASVAALFLVGKFLTAPELRAAAPATDAVLGSAALEGATFTVEASGGALKGARWRLDGVDVSTRAASTGTRGTLTLAALSEGEHSLVVSSSGSLPWSSASVRWDFSVDATPPQLTVPPTSLAAERGQPYELTGTVESGATLLLYGNDVPLVDGAFALSFEKPPSRALEFVARDAAGNESAHRLEISIIPRQPDAPVRGVHVSAAAWSNAELRSEILRLVDEGLINTVELDLKDELGEIGYASEVELGKQAGATRSYYDLKEAVALLHGKGVRVIGRLVAFRDPILVEWAWAAGRRGLVVQSPDGAPYAAYGGFSNPASSRVRQYNIDIAEEAAQAGVDDILYDYVRRPDGPLETMVFPGIDTSLEATVIQFLEETEARLDPYGTFIGASVFGIAALRPQDVAQNVERIADHVDYVSPMVYPSHWSSGVYDVASPDSEPYAIVRRSLEDFGGKVEGRGARLIPWLQDFSIGVPYGPAEV
ncbi:MAG: putative glycoside hydrolase, partial [Gaiellaceae bacterium]